MKYLHILPIVGWLFLVGGCRPSGKDMSADIYFQRADSLLQLLTLEEKAGQMTNVGLTALTEGPFWNNFDTLVLDTAKLRYFLLEHHIGSIQNKGIYPPSREEWHRIIKTIQDYIAEHSRHNIPVIYGMDAVHGANYTAGSTLFPHQIGLAASWNPELARITGEVTAYEMRASSQPWNYAPVLDVSMQPLWGRIFETFGEDTYINSVMGRAFVEGQQGASISDSTRVAVCIKHFVGYGTPFSGKDRSPAYIPEHYLRQYYIEPFRHAINAGALTAMLNSGSVNGIPGHADKYFITDILKGELGLKGFVLSDWQDVDRLVTMHHVAKDSREAVKIAVMAGLDMSMTPYDADFAKHVVDLVNAGEIPMSRVDDAVRRILYVKFKLGLFEAPYHDPAGYDKFGSDEFAELSYQAALESITLLKNQDNLLPLNYGTNILVSGPTAHALTALNGPWSRTWAGDDPAYDDPGKKTLLEALQDEFGKQHVSYTPGTGYEGEVESEARLLRLAGEADVILLALGERPATEKPSDINELDLPPNQVELVKRLHKSGKPIILVFLQGRPRVIRVIEPLADAILMAYWPGHEGGRALASLLSGRVNPSSKLPYTWPRYSGSLYTYQHKGSDRLGKTFDMDGFNPQWEFGHGLSYTHFQYGNLKLSEDTIHTGEALHLSVRLKNTGNYPGKEVVQLYLRDLVASITPDNRKLIAFEKVYLEPGQVKTVDFTITHEDLMFVNLNNEWIAEEGDFEILIGGKPANLITERFFLKK
ncbi:MAG: glycoside hydrolase family 3 N-terminal domain-containing protein [Bacteroidales bacterium]|nr:glycoside hydrolase family 3 N-terminal domain-containing protein [Bacteroidales bacterium]